MKTNDRNMKIKAMEPSSESRWPPYPASHHHHHHPMVPHPHHHHHHHHPMVPHPHHHHRVLCPVHHNHRHHHHTISCPLHHHHHHTISCPLHHHHHLTTCHSHLSPTLAPLSLQNNLSKSTTVQIEAHHSVNPDLQEQEYEEVVEFEEEDEDDEPIFVLTDEWKEFFAKSEAKRKLEKKQAKKKQQKISNQHEADARFMELHFHG